MTPGSWKLSRLVMTSVLSMASMAVDRHGDIGMRCAGDLVLSQGHELGAAWHRQRAPRGRDEVMVRPPGGDEHAAQADIQEPGDRGAGLTEGGVAGYLRQPFQVGKHPGNLCGQQWLARYPGGALARVGEQCQRTQWLRGSDRAHGWTLSSWLDTSAGCGSMRTVLVTSVPVSRMRTAPDASACCLTWMFGRWIRSQRRTST